MVLSQMWSSKFQFNLFWNLRLFLWDNKQFRHAQHFADAFDIYTREENIAYFRQEAVLQ